MTPGGPPNETADDGGPAVPHVPLLEDELDAHDTNGPSGRNDPSGPGSSRETADEVKPTWRGWIHAGTFPVAIVLGIILIVLAEGVAAKVSSAIFVLSALLLFGNSALYHRLNWKPRARVLLKRIDHANIFLLIAGSYTPLTVLCLTQPHQTILLSIIWGGAGLGILFRIFFISAPRWLYVPLYVLLGWAAVLYIVDFFNANPVTMTLVLVGGLFYTVGAVIYGLKKPNPFPGRFGFHEIFHTFTLLAFLTQWVGILLIATHPPLLH